MVETIWLHQWTRAWGWFYVDAERGRYWKWHEPSKGFFVYRVWGGQWWWQWREQDHWLLCDEWAPSKY